MAPGSNEATATPRMVPEKPEAPTGLMAKVGNSEVTLEWTLGGDGGSTVTGHEYRQKLGGGNFDDNWIPIENSAPGQGNATSFTVDSLANGTTYVFQVRAVSGIGGGAESNEATATPRMVPEAPTGLVATAGNSEVTLE